MSLRVEGPVAVGDAEVAVVYRQSVTPKRTTRTVAVFSEKRPEAVIIRRPGELLAFDMAGRVLSAEELGTLVGRKGEIFGG